jgi:hypothetical protein
MALSYAGQVYQWGGAWQRLLCNAGSSATKADSLSTGTCSASRSTAAPAKTRSSSNSIPASTVSTAIPGAVGAAQDASTAGRKLPVPWLDNLQVTHIACGVETAAALTNSQQLLLWGSSDSLPRTTTGQATPLAAAAFAAHHLLQSPRQMQAAAEPYNITGVAVDRVAPKAPGVANVLATHHGQQAVAVKLLVMPAGDVQLVLSPMDHHQQPPQQQQQHAEQSFYGIVTAQQLPAPEAVVDSCSSALQATACPTVAKSMCSGDALISQDCCSGAECFPDCDGADDVPQAAAAADHLPPFDPDREPVVAVSCGAGHQVLLCQPSLHTPSTGVTGSQL